MQCRIDKCFYKFSSFTFLLFNTPKTPFTSIECVNVTFFFLKTREVIELGLNSESSFNSGFYHRILRREKCTNHQIMDYYFVTCKVNWQNSYTDRSFDKTEPIKSTMKMCQSISSGPKIVNLVAWPFIDWLYTYAYWDCNIYCIVVLQNHHF